VTGQPLTGARVGVTRSRVQASQLSTLLKERGAFPVELSCLEFADPESFEPLDAALARLPDGYDGVLFTSTNAVERTLSRTRPEALARVRIAVTGSATAEALKSRGIEADVVPQRFLSEGLLEALDAAPEPLSGSRWLLPRAEVAREVLPDGLRARGATVEVVTAYRTVPPADPKPLRERAKSGLDAITFASGSTVNHLRAALGADFELLLEGVAVASIGPVTSEACRAAGLRVDIQPERATLADLVDALAAWWATR